MNKLEVEVTDNSNVRPQAGDVVQNIDIPEYFFFVSGRGHKSGSDKESCFTTNAQIVKGKFKTYNNWFSDTNMRIVMRKGQPFTYPAKSGYKTEIDGVRYKLIPENEQ